ncbi:unnamed protein product, partial [Pocillopora meandrina]
HEIIWLKLDPSRSPRGFSCILLAVVYYPGRNSPAESDSQNLLNHLFDSLKSAESLYPNYHSTVIVKPKERILNQHTRKKINIRDMRESKKTSLGRYLSNVDWSCINMQSSCEGKLR